MMMTTMTAQRHTDRLDRGLVVSKVANGNYLTWRRLTGEYYDVTYNVYRNGSSVANNLKTTNYRDNSSSEDNSYTIEAIVNGTKQPQCAAFQKQWANDYIGDNNYISYLPIALAPVYDRSHNEVTSHYEPNDIEMADLDGDGQLEIIVKRLNTVDAAGYDSGLKDKKGNARYIIYPRNSNEFSVFDAYDIDWQTGTATLLWRIDCGPNMVSHMSTETNIIAYDWDENGKAEVVLRGADNMIVYGSDGVTPLYNIGDMTVNTRDTWYTTNEQGSSTGSMAYTHSGAEYLLYLNGETGALYQQMEYPLKRLENNESDLNAAWGDGYGHRSSKYFFGAPFLDGRKASLFLGRGIYTRHKMIALDLNRDSHTWTTRWTWSCNNSNSPWYGNGYHNYLIADVDEDGRDEIIYGSMVIDDNGKGLSTTGFEHGDAQHVSDFDPYRKGLEFFGCLENGPYYGCNYRNATTSKVYYKKTSTGDDGRALMGNFYNNYPGAIGRSASMGLWVSSVTDQEISGTETISDDKGDGNNHLNSRIYWDGDLCSEILDSPGTASYACIVKPGSGRIFTSANRKQTDGGVMVNGSKNNPCFLGDIIGDWREEIIVRHGTDIRVYTTNVSTDYSLPTLWNDHQYRQAMVWQMMAYNQPPHLSYFLGELEGITVAPPTLTNEGRTEIADEGTVGRTGDREHLLICETGDMTVSVEDGAAPSILTVNTPTWVQGTDENGTSGTKVRGDGSVGATNLPEIRTTTYTHTLTGGAFAGTMRLVKQGDGVLVLPDVTEAYTGETNVWAGTLRFNGTMASSPVWLNRFATLDTDGGTFDGGVTADYGATIAVGTGGINISTLTLNHGARLKVSIGSDGKATPVNISNLILKKKSGEAWEQYGPKYLKPVIEFTHSGLLDGVYFLGNVGSVTGDISNDVVLEGLNGVNSPRLQADGGKLFLIVGTGESVTCPEATFAVSGYQRTANGLLPVVRIEPGTFSYGGSEVTPTLSAMYNGTAMDLLTLYSEDYEQATDASGWTNGAGRLELVTGVADYGNYIHHAMWGIDPAIAANRSFYTLFGKNLSGIKSYSIELDAIVRAGNVAERSGTDFVIMSKGAVIPTTKNIGYGYNADKCNAPGTNYLFRMTAANSQTFTINDSITQNINAVWTHFVINIDTEARTATYTLTQGTSVVAQGTFNIPDGTSCEAFGLFVLDGRGSGDTCIDNIRIYRTDGQYFAFTEPGTLTVTTGYPGCLSGTATYNVTEYVKMGDANMDGRVDISDVTAAISHIASQTPAVFCKEAADMDGNGTVEAADLRAIANLIVGSNQ